MGRAPAPTRPGSAAAIEEMSYEIGGVLGVAVLGSLAGVVYRAGLPAGAGGAARESVAGALGTPVAAAAMASFTDALAVVGLAGRCCTLLAAVGRLVAHPADLDLADAAPLTRGRRRVTSSRAVGDRVTLRRPGTSTRTRAIAPCRLSRRRPAPRRTPRG